MKTHPPRILRPYLEAASDYWDRGYSPLPLPPAAKFPPPAGFTGRNGTAPTQTQIEQWILDQGDGNVALRLPDDVVGIDIDAYNGGLETITELESRLGPLPATVAATSRDDGSGIRLYRLPEPMECRQGLGAGVDVIQASHRYVTAPPSLHPGTGRSYRWIDSATSEPISEIPRASDLDVLSPPWVDELRRSSPSQVTAERATEEEIHEFLAAHDTEVDTDIIDELAERFDERIARGDSRHDTLVAIACETFRCVSAGLISSWSAIEMLEGRWELWMDDAERRAGKEFDEAVAWAIGQVLAGGPLGTINDLGAAASSMTNFVVQVPRQWDDATVSASLADALRGKYRWNSAFGWLVWTGTYWAEDSLESVQEMTRQWVLALELHLRSTFTASSKALRGFASLKCRSRIESIVTLARRQAGIATPPEDFDTHNGLLNVANGVIDLQKSKLLPHDPDLLLTQIAPVAYVPGAQHPDLDTMLACVDPDVADWLQVFFGYVATGEVSEDMIVFLEGTGSNGKSTLIGSIAAAMGTYAFPGSTQTFLAAGRMGHQTVIASLKGRRMIYVEELPEGGVLNDERLKSLTGGTPLVARFLYRDEFSFMPTHKLIMSTNYEPRINKSDNGIWRRLRLVQFNKSFTVDPADGTNSGPVDKGLRSRLTNGAFQQAAILAWIVEGSRRWYAEGIPTCSTIEAATKRWRQEEDIIERLASEALIFGAGEEVTARSLYLHYTTWCQQEGRPPMSQKNFKKMFENHDVFQRNHIGIVRPQGTVTYRGVSFGSSLGSASWGGEGW